MPPPDLKTAYLGFDLPNPFVVSSCPLTGDLGSLRALERAGAAAVVLPSLFQEQIEHDELELGRLHEMGGESFAEAPSYLPDFTAYNAGPDGYLRLVESARKALAIPVIASLNGIDPEGWERYAKRIEAAGASAIELNVAFVPTDPDVSGADVERMCTDLVSIVHAAVSVPLAVKIGPHLSAPAHLAARLAEAGARGLVLFNRPLDPDIDLERLEVVPRLDLSQTSEMRMPLRWIAILAPRTSLSLAATSGVHDALDAARLIMAGADAVMLASVLLRRGPEHLRTLRQELADWMESREYASVAQMKDSMNHANCPNPSGWERSSYMRALISFTGPWT